MEVLVEKEQTDKAGMMLHTFNLGTQKAKSVILSQPGLYRKFQANQDCMVRPCFQKGWWRGVWRAVTMQEALLIGGVPYPAQCLL